MKGLSRHFVQGQVSFSLQLASPGIWKVPPPPPTPSCRSIKLSNDVDGPLWRVLVLLWKLWSCESCSLRSRNRAEFWSTPRRSVSLLISPRPICEGRRLARSCALARSRDWQAAQPPGEEEIHWLILGRVQDTIIYDTIAGLWKLQINIGLLCTGKPPEHLQPPWPQLCRQWSFGHLACCFFHIEKVPPPTTHYKCYKLTLSPNNDSVVCLFTSGNVESCLDEDEVILQQEPLTQTH